VLWGFSVALFIGTIVGTYSTIAIASPIMVWWQERLESGRTTSAARSSAGPAARARGGAKPAATASASRAGGRGTSGTGGGGVRSEPQGAARS
jgi:preprotein translocase subunit SecF